MTESWFRLDKSGWFFYPINYLGWSLIFFTIISLLLIQYFTIIYCSSRSIGQVLVISFPHQALVIVIFLIIAFLKIESFVSENKVETRILPFLLSLLIFLPLTLYYYFLKFYLGSLEIFMALIGLMLIYFILNKKYRT